MMMTCVVMVHGEAARGRTAMSDKVRGHPGDRGRGAGRPTAGIDFFTALVRRRGDVTDLVTHLLGRPVRPRLLGQYVIRRVRSPGLVRLRTTGPFLHRHVRLEDS